MDPEQGYPEAKRLLKERFGDKYKISMAYLDKALNWPIIKKAIFLTSCSNAMADLEYLDEMENAANMCTIIAKLPYRLRLAICLKGGFRLTKWMTNNRDVLTSIPQEDLATEVKNLDFDQESLAIERALGVQWCIRSDQFKFHVNIQQRPLTRRGILSMMSSVYDPLGMLSPVILPAKNILQELCRLRTGWDEAVTDHLAQQWSRWMEKLQQLTNVGVDRCFKPPEFGDTVEARLHHFSDASETDC